MGNQSINQFYLRKELLPALKKGFRENAALPSLALGEFVERKKFLALRNAKHTWTEEWTPDKHRYKRTTGKKEKELLNEIKNFLHSIVGKIEVSSELRRFRAGSYTILHDKETQKQGVVVFLFLDDWNPEWGGQLVFTKNGETLGSFIPRANTLLVVERKKNVQSFVKYINHRAGKSKIDILC